MLHGYAEDRLVQGHAVVRLEQGFSDTFEARTWWDSAGLETETEPPPTRFAHALHTLHVGHVRRDISVEDAPIFHGFIVVPSPCSRHFPEDSLL